MVPVIDKGLYTLGMVKLLVTTPAICCPECKMVLEIVNSTPERVVLVHSKSTPYERCPNDKKLFSVKLTFIEALEI